jgi:hypothetical protein
MTDLDKPEELSKAATRVAAYLDRRSQSRGLDKEEIHAFDVGPDGEGFYLRSSDLRAVASQVLARRQPDTAAATADAVRNTITRFLTADDPTHWGEFERRLAVAVGMTPSTAEDASMAGGEDGDVEWPESPLANALFDHVQSQFSLDRDEASEEAGEILQILADHGVDPTKLPTPADPRQALVKISAVTGEAG